MFEHIVAHLQKSTYGTAAILELGHLLPGHHQGCYCSLTLAALQLQPAHGTTFPLFLEVRSWGKRLTNPASSQLSEELPKERSL